MARKVYDLASRRVSVTRTPEPVDDPDRGAHPKRSDSAKRSPEPFGEADCESEVRTLKTEYSKLYFDETLSTALRSDRRHTSLSADEDRGRLHYRNTSHSRTS